MTQLAPPPEQFLDLDLPLPVAWYVDPAVLEVERRHVFGTMPRYVGQELMVPERGSYHVLEWMDDAWMLLRGDAGVQLVSNICRHRQAVMHQGRGQVRNVVCPIHRWSYDVNGRLQAAPHFDPLPCRDLPTRPLNAWNGLLFEGPGSAARHLAGFSLAERFDYSGYVYQSTAVDEYAVNWKTFMEIYLELLHVDPFHNGLRGYADCGAFDPADWEFGETWSNQVITLRSDVSRASESYQRYLDLVTSFRGRRPDHAALWFCLYPATMLEWYPEALAVSFLIPRTPSSTVNVVDFFYPAEVLAERPEIVEAHQAAYEESALEDREIVERIDRGRQALYVQGIEDVGPYQDPLEAGMVHFHRWLRDRIEPHLAGRTNH